MADLNINRSDTVTTLEAYNLTGVSVGGRLWSCGAEQQSVSLFGGELDASHNASISTSIFRSGLASFRCQATTATTNIEKQFVVERAGDTFYSRGYVYFTAFPSSISTGISGAHSDITIMDLTSSDGSFCEVTIDASGVIRAYSDGNPRTLLGTTSAINTGQWYRLELACSTYYRYVEARLDGVLIGSANNIVGFESYKGVNLAIWGCGLLASESSTVDMYWDDLAVNQGSGATSQISWPGSGNVTNQVPGNTGDNNSFTINVGGTAGQANNFTRVNQVPASDVQYNGDTINGDADDLLVTATPSAITSGDTINVVHVGIRYKLSATSTGTQLVTRLKKTSGGTLTTYAITPANTSFQNFTAPPFNTGPYSYPITLYNDPDGLPWAKSTLDSSQVGYQILSSSSTELDISAVWLVVDSTPGTASLSINTSDTTTTSEMMNDQPSDTNLNKSDTTTTSESINIVQEYNLSVSDTTTTSELSTVNPPLQEIDDDPDDTSHMSERLTVYLPLANTKYIIVNDDVKVTDTPSILGIPPSYVGPFGPLKFTIDVNPYNFSIERFNPNDP